MQRDDRSADSMIRSEASAAPPQRPRARGGAATDEGYEVLISLALLSEATREHLRALHFPTMSAKKIQRVSGPLLRASPPLVEERLRYNCDDKLKPPVPLASVLRLTEAGHAAVRNDARYPIRTGPDQYAARLSDPTRSQTLEHDLQATDAVVSIVQHARAQGLSGLFLRREIRLDPDQPAPRIDVVLVLHVGGVIPGGMTCWTKNPPGPDEARAVIGIESDRDTEAISVIRGKARAYRRARERPSVGAYWSAQYGGSPLILWLAPTVRRLQHIARAWAEEWPDGDWLLVTPEGLRANQIAAYYRRAIVSGRLFSLGSEATVNLEASEDGPAAGWETFVVPPLVLPAPAPQPAASGSPAARRGGGERRPVPSVPTVRRLLPLPTPTAHRPLPPPIPGTLLPPQELSMHLAGMDAAGKHVTDSPGPLTMEFWDEYGHRLGGCSYMRYDIVVSLPRPAVGRIKIVVLETPTVEWCQGNAKRAVFGVLWPPPLPPPPPPPLRWNDLPASMHGEIFVAARARLRRPWAVQHLFKRVADGLGAVATTDSATVGLLWQGLPGQVNIVHIALAVLATLVAPVIIGSALLGSLTLLLLLAATWMLRGIGWGVSTVWRARHRNIYRPGLWLLSTMLMLGLVSLSGLTAWAMGERLWALYRPL